MHPGEVFGQSPFGLEILFLHFGFLSDIGGESFVQGLAAQQQAFLEVMVQCQCFELFSCVRDFFVKECFPFVP